MALGEQMTSSDEEGSLVAIPWLWNNLPIAFYFYHGLELNCEEACEIG